MVNVIGAGIYVFETAIVTPVAPTVTGADNGLSLSGTIVELGGPLIKNTTVEAANFLLRLQDTSGSNIYELLVNRPTNQVGIIYSNGISNSSCFVGVDDTPGDGTAEVVMTDNAGNESHLHCNPTGFEMSLTAAGNNIFKAGLILASTDYSERIAIGVTQDLVNKTFGAAGIGVILSINPYISVNSVAAGNAIILVSYTDYTNVARTISYAAVTTLTASAYNPVIIRCKANTNVRIQAVLTGVINVNAGCIAQTIGLAPN